MRRLALLSLCFWLLLAVPPVGAPFGTTVPNPYALNGNATIDNALDRFPTVYTDGSGVWMASWDSEDTLGGTIGADVDILVASSTDNGATWSFPVPLNTNAGTDSGDDFRSHVLSDGSGGWVGVWGSRDDLGGTIGTDSDILFAHSTDNGATWTDPAPLNSNAASDAGDNWMSHVATDGAGNWIVGWYSYDSLGDTIGTDGDILYARSSDNGMTWTAAAALNSNAFTSDAGDFGPALATDRSGNWVATWHSTDSLGGTIGADRDVLISRSTDNGETWTPAAPMTSDAAIDSGDDFPGPIAVDESGNWVAASQSNDSLGGAIGTDADIVVSRSSDGGATWTPFVPLNSNAAIDSGGDHAPAIATDGAGNWVAGWYSYDTLGGTIGSDPDILVALSTDNGATWTAPEYLKFNAPTDNVAEFAVSLAADSARNWIGAWDSLDNLGGPIGADRDILATRWVLCDARDDDADGFSIGCDADCDDGLGAVYPGAPELCDGYRNDCNDASWPETPANEYDDDLDGFRICDGDCDDASASVYPTALETCNTIDDDCDTLIDEDGLGEDSDADRVHNLCDNCLFTPNAAQTDLDADSEGDSCDLDDGVIWVYFAQSSYVEWQEETGLTRWNVYRGDLDILKAGGDYTQFPDSNGLARRDCRLVDPFLFDEDPVPPGLVAFYLTSGVSGVTEVGLGTDSWGQPRPNTNACP